MTRVLVAAALALLSTSPAPASANEQADGVFGHVSYEALTGAGTIYSDSANQTPTFWARAEGKYTVGRLQLALRLDGSSETEGVVLAQPRTYQTLEGFAFGSFRLVRGVALAGAIGATRPAIGLDGPVRRTWIVGPIVGNRDRYVMFGPAGRDMVAPGLLGGAAWRWQVREKTAVFGDVAARRARDCTPDGVCGPPRLAYQARVSVAVTVLGAR